MGAASFVVGVAHDGSCFAQRVSLIVNGPLDIGEVGGKDGHFVVKVLHLLDNVRVPILSPRYVRVALGVIVLSPIQTVSNVTGKDRANRQTGFHLVDIDAVLEPTQGLVRISLTRLDGFVARRVFPVNNLIHNT